MAFTLSFPTSGPIPGPKDLAAWLTAQGEPFEQEGTGVLQLRALPMRLVHTGTDIQAQVDVTPTVPLSRMNRLLFDLSMRLGADVRLVGVGEVNRPELWLRLANEQDRMRIAAALDKAAHHNNRDEILRAFWSILGSLGPGRDLRWDTRRDCIVDVQEVGAADGITLEDARWHDANVSTGDTVSVPMGGDLHILAWRWLSEAWPSLIGTWEKS